MAAASGSAAESGSAAASESAAAFGSAAAVGTAVVFGSVVASGSAVASGLAAASGLVEASGSAAASGSVEASGSVVASEPAAVMGLATAFGAAVASGSAVVSESVVVSGSAVASGLVVASELAVALGLAAAFGSTAASGAAAVSGSEVEPGSAAAVDADVRDQVLWSVAGCSKGAKASICSVRCCGGYSAVLGEDSLSLLSETGWTRVLRARCRRWGGCEDRAESGDGNINGYYTVLGNSTEDGDVEGYESRGVPDLCAEDEGHGESSSEAASIHVVKGFRCSGKARAESESDDSTWDYADTSDRRRSYFHQTESSSTSWFRRTARCAELQETLRSHLRELSMGRQTARVRFLQQLRLIFPGINLQTVRRWARVRRELEKAWQEMEAWQRKARHRPRRGYKPPPPRRSAVG